METVVLTIRPYNIAVIALMVLVIGGVYYAIVRAGVEAKKTLGSPA